MALAAHRCMMTAPEAPLVRSAYDAVPQAGEVLVEVAGCGVCHTDLGYFYDGVRTNHPLPLALGHEISGKVVAAGDGAAEWVLDSKVQLKPFVEAHPLNDINHVFEAVHHRDIKRRAVMVPAN